jgi:hypothetical protein
MQPTKIPMTAAVASTIKSLRGACRPRDIRLQKFNCRAKNDRPDTQKPFTSEVGHPETKSCGQKYCGVLGLVGDKCSRPGVFRNQRQHDYGPEQEPSHHPVNILQQYLSSNAIFAVCRPPTSLSAWLVPRSKGYHLARSLAQLSPL